MIAVIRIAGKVDIPEDIKRTLDRLNIKRKYSCTVISDDEEKKGMVNRVRDFVAYGEIEEDTFEKLIENRAEIKKSKGGEGNKGKKDKKIDADKIIKEFKEGKKLSELGIKPFFRLHPPRGGIDTKQHYPKGVLGKHKEINKLINRML